jgi:hypothetical protein
VLALTEYLLDVPPRCMEINTTAKTRRDGRRKVVEKEWVGGRRLG